MNSLKPIDYNGVTGQYQKTELKSGLRVVTESMPHVQSLAIGVWVLTGSRFEQASQNGISHLLEHMVFKGTRTRSAYDIAVSLESLGGHLNAFTGREHTCYYAIVLKDNLDKAVEVLADIVLNPKLDNEDLHREKQVILEEIDNLEDSPEDWIHDLWVQTVFDDHALGRPILGNRESVTGLGREQIADYHAGFYTGENMIVAAAGALNHDDVVTHVGRFFDHIARGKRVQPKPVPFPEKNVDAHIPAAINQVHLCTGTTTWSYLDQRKFPLIVLNAYLGGGMSARLFQELREARGLAYSVFSSTDFWSDMGLFSIYAGTNPRNDSEVREILNREMRHLSEYPLDDNDLKRVKTQLTRSAVLALEDHSNRMNRLAKMEAYTHTYMPVSEVVRLILDVEPGQILQAADLLFKQQVQISTAIQPE